MSSSYETADQVKMELELALVAIPKSIHDDLGPNPKKLWLINQSISFHEINLVIFH